MKNIPDGGLAVCETLGTLRRNTHHLALWKSPDTLNSHHSRAGGLCWEYRLVREGFTEEVMSRTLKGGRRRGVPSQGTGLAQGPAIPKHSSRLVHRAHTEGTP